jgi:mRNA interferase MazF
MVIKQGDIFWIDLDHPSGSEPGYSHPFVVVQNNIFNKSQIGTVIVCAITSNLKRAKSPGNILFFPGESDLPKQSVVNISQIYTVDKKDLSEKIGTLSPERVQEMLDGMDLILKPRDIQHI